MATVSESDIQDMLASVWTASTNPDTIDFYVGKAGDWMRITADGISRLDLDVATLIQGDISVTR